MRLASVFSVLCHISSANGDFSEAGACATFEEPGECVEGGCLWLAIDGKCSTIDDPHAKANPTCCVGGEGSPCDKRHVSDFKDGDCQMQLHPNGPVTEAPPVEQMLRFAYISGSTYCEASKLQQWACGEGCDQAAGILDVSVVTKSDFQAIVAFSERENAVVVSFRGTVQDIQNWATNLNYFKTYPFENHPDVGVHRGFYEAYQSLRGPVLSAVQALSSARGVSSVYVTGHSLGGALAHHCALDLADNFKFDSKVFSFGAPRTGDYKFSQLVLEKVTAVYRVTHRQDIVPHVPLELMGFYHLSSEVFFPETSGLSHRLCDGSGEDKKCANDCGFLGCVSIDDHLTYLDISLTGLCTAALVV